MEAYTKKEGGRLVMTCYTVEGRRPPPNYMYGASPFPEMMMMTRKKEKKNK